MTIQKPELKISFLIPNSGIGGGVRSTAVMANILLQRGHQVRIFYRHNRLGVKRKLGNLYRRYRFGPNHDWMHCFRGFSAEYNSLDAGMFSPGEIIISMCAQTTLDMCTLPQGYGFKVLYCRGPEIDNWDRMIEAWGKPVPKIVTSSYIADLIKREVSQPVEAVIPNGVDTREYYQELPGEEKSGIGAILGSSRPKDPRTAVQVMKMLEHSMPEVPRYMFGSISPKQKVHAQYFRQPSVDQARGIYSRCKAWFCASLSEGFGNPLLEAMACGCVVVSTDCGGPRDIIKDGENGFLVNIGNAGAMVYKLGLICRDDELCRRLSANALRTARKFKWRKSADKMEKYLIELSRDTSRRQLQTA